ncbi:MAG TPA: tryptophan--tRNA ligase [Rhodospirillaceae bacterium]|jgi:tryptophanyl-tRNA synthetase|nr:tryptophan--tRNA ligase [Rhodospirillaceae bacterium]
MTKTVLSCVQPTEGLHLGNYLGAMRRWAPLQEEEGAQCLYGVVDLHAITVPQDPAALAQRTREAAAAFLACGVDPARSVVFVQSAVPEHTALMWLLACCTPLGRLGRMTQFKDKSGKNEEKAPLGLFAYPVLMAADILLYKATHVPVGEDQAQHLELAREVARTWAARFGPLFPEPEALVAGPAPRVMSLRDASKKMSKSDPSAMSRIALTDDADTIARKIQKARTDDGPVPASPAEAEGRAEAVNLLTVYAALANEDQKSLYKQFGGKPFSEFKVKLTEVAVDALAPITQRMRELLQNSDYIDKILSEGSQKARALAAPTLAEAERAVGLWHTS